MVRIHDYAFNRNTPENIKTNAKNVDWPVVYLINSETELYVGETISAVQRMKQHLENPQRQRLNKLHVIDDDDFNKSATLDVESSLISLMSADGKYRLQNSSSGVAYHKYSNMAEFSIHSQQFNQLWNELKKRNLVKNELEQVRNSDLFKFSPYKSLTEDQCVTRDNIVAGILDGLRSNTDKSFIVEGSAGTGKTVLALYLLFLFSNENYDDDEENQLEYEFSKDLKEIKKIKKLKVAYVVAMTSLRATLKKVAKQIKGLKANMIIAPSDTVKDHYDILIVDEAHRLKRTVGLGADVGSFYKTNRKLGFGDKDGTQLDWILKQSSFQILFYDSEQQIKPSDIRKEDFDRLLYLRNSERYTLESQMRCIGGNDYIHYIKNILNCEQEVSITRFKNYDFKMFTDINLFTDAMVEMENQYGLCRIAAGYAWEWISKKDNNMMDINIHGRQFKWNQQNKEFILSINGKQIGKEIGCIYTMQGYDLNYCGVIIGNEITYNKNTNRIEVIRDNYYDATGKQTVKSNKELHDYIVNIYYTLMTRGIHGTYVYCCDEALKQYLTRYIPTF